MGRWALLLLPVIAAALVLGPEQAYDDGRLEPTSLAQGSPVPVELGARTIVLWPQLGRPGYGAIAAAEVFPDGGTRRLPPIVAERSQAIGVIAVCPVTDHLLVATRSYENFAFVEWWPDGGRRDFPLGAIDSARAPFSLSCGTPEPLALFSADGRRLHAAVVADAGLAFVPGGDGGPYGAAISEPLDTSFDDLSLQVAGGSGSQLVVYTDDGGATGVDLFGLFVDARGNPLGAPFRVASTADNDLDPMVASDGTSWLVVWRSQLPSANPNQLWAALVRSDGGVGAPEQLVANEVRAAVAWDGSRYRIAWVSGSDVVSAVYPLDGGGGPVTVPGFPSSALWWLYLDGRGDGTAVLGGFTNPSDGGPATPAVSWLSGSTATIPAPVTYEPPLQRGFGGATLLPGGHAFAIESPVGGAGFVALIDGGTFSRTLFGSQASWDWAGVLNDGTTTLVVAAHRFYLSWRRFDPAFAPMTPDEEAGLPTPVTVKGITAARDSRDFVVVVSGHDYRADHSSDLELFTVRISADGGVRGATPLEFDDGGTHKAFPALAFHSSDVALVTWLGSDTYRYGRRFLNDVPLDDPPLVLGAQADPFPVQMAVAAGQSGFLAVWSTSSTAELGATLVPLSGPWDGGRLTLASADFPQVRPAVAFDGRHYGVLFATGGPTNDVFLRFVEEDGTVSPVVPVATTADDELVPAIIALSPGVWQVGYSRWLPSAGTMRFFSRTLMEDDLQLDGGVNGGSDGGVDGGVDGGSDAGDADPHRPTYRVGCDCSGTDMPGWLLAALLLLGRRRSTRPAANREGARSTAASKAGFGSVK